MALQAGIVGLPNVGKSTLFNAVSNSAKAQASNYRFCTIDPNVGLVDVPDPRVKKLAELVNPNRIVPTQIEIVDIAGRVIMNPVNEILAQGRHQIRIDRKNLTGGIYFARMIAGENKAIQKFVVTK